MKNFILKKKILFLLGYFYLLLPILIFIFGWMKWYWIVISVLIIGASIFFLIKHTPDIDIPTIKNKKDIAKIIVAIVFLFLIVRLSGIGNSVSQTSDHYWRNTIFDALVEYDWPISVIDVYGESRGLVYYISFWLPSAVIGKIFGLYAGYAFQVIWGVFGLVIVYFFLCSYMKKISLLPLFIFIFFSGLDVVSHALEIIYFGGGPLSGSWSTEFLSHIEWHSVNYFSINYLSNLTNIYWIYNQTIPLWISLFIIINLKDNKSIVFIAACSILSSILSIVALAPFLLFYIVSNNVEGKILYRRLVNKDEIKLKLREMITIENIFGGLFIAIVSLSYLLPSVDPNQTQVGTNGIYIGINLADLKSILFYALYLFFEFGIYFVLLYKDQKGNGVFLLSLIMLIVAPIISIGNNQDFCMKGTVPYLMFICLFILDSIDNKLKNKEYVRLSILLEVLFVGSLTCFREIFRLLKDTIILYQNNNFILDGFVWILKDTMMVLLVCLQIIYIVYLFKKNNINKYLRYGSIVYLFLISLCSIVTYGINYSYYLELALINNNWNAQVPAMHLFITPNFSGSTSYNLFYKFFARI